MHAVKKLAVRGGNNAAGGACSTDVLLRDYETRLERSKRRLRKRFEALAAADNPLSSLFRLSHLVLGVGSFGMVLQAEAVLDITAGRLCQEQDAKWAAETPAGGGQRLQPRRRSLELRPEAVLLRRGQRVAIKFEYNVDHQQRKFQLIKEHALLVELFNCYEGKLEGFPEPYLFGCLGDATFSDAGGASATTKYHCYHFLVMELLGGNLRARFDELPVTKQPGTTAFPVELAFDVARQLLTRLMFLHTAPISVTHNDLKLDQLMLGRNDKKNTVYLVDFGLSLKYKKGTRARWGNRRYASRFRQQGVNSPLTDLESVAYVVARFLHNAFPWDGLQCSSDSEKKHKISAIKSQLWSFVDRVRRGRCLRSEDGGEGNEWPRSYFADRTDAAGRGGPELLKYMSRLSEYSRSETGASLPAEEIDYNFLFNCFASSAS